MRCPWGAPYFEDDPVAPLGVYRTAKAEVERVLLTAPSDVLLIRTGPFFGPWDDRNVVTRAIRAVGLDRLFSAAADVTISPTYLPDLADTTLDLLMDRETGVWNLASAGAVTWADFAREAVRGAGLDLGRILAVPDAELAWKARRPAQSVLRSGRGVPLPPLGEALGCCVDALLSGVSDISTGSYLTRYRPPG